MKMHTQHIGLKVEWITSAIPLLFPLFAILAYTPYPGNVTATSWAKSLEENTFLSETYVFVAMSFLTGSRLRGKMWYRVAQRGITGQKRLEAQQWIAAVLVFYSSKTDNR